MLLHVDVGHVSDGLRQSKIRRRETVDVGDRRGPAELAYPIEEPLETRRIDVEPSLKADDVHLRYFARWQCLEGLQIDLRNLDTVPACDRLPVVKMGVNLRR